MNHTEETFLDLYRCALNEEEITDCSDSEILRIAEQNGIYPLITEKLGSRDDRSKRKAVHMTLRQAESTSEFLSVYRYLKRCKLNPFVMDLRRLYDNPERIQCTEQVLCVSKDEYDQCSEALLEYGLSQDKDSYYNQKVWIRLKTGEYPSVTESIYSVKVSVPSYTEHLGILLKEEMNLRNITDINLFSLTYEDQIDWDRIIEENDKSLLQSIYTFGYRYLYPYRFTDHLKEMYVNEEADLSELEKKIFSYKGSTDHSSLMRKYTAPDEERGLRRIYRKSYHSSFAPVLNILFRIVSTIEFHILNLYWLITEKGRPSKEEQELVRNNVTFFFKSFERQKLAEGLIRNINQMYPGVQIIAADDSKEPLTSSLPNVQIIHLPYNSGLSAGLKAALEKVNTPYVMRMDDDELLTDRSYVHRELKYLVEHKEIDLIGFGYTTAIRCRDARRSFDEYYKDDMKKAPEPLRIPHGTKLDNNHVILGKVANIYLARTEKIREVGFDENIHVIDHHDFFTRAAGIIVSCAALDTAVFHRHNPYDHHYNRYRSDYFEDLKYLSRKRHRGGKEI